MAILLMVAGCTTSATPVESCTMAVCPLGGHTYRFCNSKGATSCYYKGSDNRTFACKSCSDCTMAASQIANWCSTGSGTTTAGTTTSGSTTSGTTTSGGTTSGLPLTGCSGLLQCYIDCNNMSQDPTCFEDCDAAATPHGLDLLNAFGECIDSNCFQATNLDSGMPYCSDATINAPPCDDCYSRILGTNGICVSAQTACTNDKP